MAPTKTVLSCRAVQLVRFTDCKQSPLSPLNAVLHMHQNESLSFDECLKDTHNYPEMRVFIILWSLKPNAKRRVSSKEPLVLFAIMLHYGWLHMSPSVRKSSATCGLFFFFFSPVEKLPRFTPHHHHQPWNIKARPHWNFKPILALPSYL